MQVSQDGRMDLCRQHLSDQEQGLEEEQIRLPTTPVNQ